MDTFWKEPVVIYDAPSFGNFGAACLYPFIPLAIPLSSEMTGAILTHELVHWEDEKRMGFEAYLKDWMHTFYDHLKTLGYDNIMRAYRTVPYEVTAYEAMDKVGFGEAARWPDGRVYHHPMRGDNGVDRETLKNLIDRRVKKMYKILEERQAVYASAEDVLYNFKKAGQILDITPQQALLGMVAKHLAALIPFGMNPKRDITPQFMAEVDEKVGDITNYLILMEALFLEKMDLDTLKAYINLDDR